MHEGGKRYKDPHAVEVLIREFEFHRKIGFLFYCKKKKKQRKPL
jgi:hypothetical protein